MIDAREVKKKKKMRKVVLTSTGSVLGFKAAKLRRPEQNSIEFDPRLIQPHAAILRK